MKVSALSLFRGIITLLFIVILSCGIGLGIYLSMPLNAQKIIFIPKGSSKSIIAYLRNNGYDVGKLDVYILHFLGKIQSGWIEIPNEYIESKIDVTPQDSTNIESIEPFNIIISRGHFLHALISAKAAMKSVTLIPGETSYFFLREVANAFNIDIDSLQKEYDKLSPLSDGIILANTYNLPLHADAHFIISYLIDTSMAKHEALSREYLGDFDKEKWFKILSKAAIIQKEAANVSEMPIVASVIENRIAKNMPLQMDGSLNYGKFSHTKITPDRIKNDTSEFNTYKHAGVPKTPSCAVSTDAIKAAIFPATTNYLYFMRNKSTGLHDFSETITQHEKLVKAARDIQRNAQKATKDSKTIESKKPDSKQDSKKEDSKETPKDSKKNTESKK
ncbi:aminodeoxychorismate lyase [Helicobacter saguini]|uniref:Endolytic murein transglycosylase n=1 Tax=Helicobacter saguini TaxID=1548018 RepID=A0A347W223_9HELI|nr:endolytic transglycosylase MltG [Helicobacter saguini]MWV62825.1 aminodeoxychorismate lyase [Helicobacter saguini]MWV66506.1 aminodeoxychorismate lyase [Helicobacter saguini]MWV68855.1 aminodeoxychorismate lyase [Helicobacter saguini]MWV71590.1 aminodeoxychorismate lyase [Helicobacter saguini]TLD94396.1 aminodeoxychorismate lyase [Helicobacter saguini]